MGTCWPKPVDSRPTTNSCSSPVHNDAKLIKNRNRHNSNSNNHENGRLSAADPNRGGEGGRGGSDHQGVPLSESTTERNSDGARGKDNNGQKINVASTFTFEELAMATQNFRESNLIGKGGFGSVYKGCLDSDVVVAVKQLNLEGLQGNQEFIVEVFMLSLLHHPNLVNLIGYCAREEQRFLVYEYMPLGSLDRLLFDLEPDQKPLGWSTRLKIALDVAHGLEYLHCKTNPPVIYRDMKSSNILLDNDFNARLSDFGVSKLGPIGENTHVSTRVVGTYGYCAPKYVISGKLTLNSDIYSFGIVLLELIIGRKVIDHTRKSGEKNLIMWFLPFLKDHKKFVQMADPLLEMRFSIRSLHHAIAITAMCLQEQPSFRPAISDIVTALESVASQMGISDHHQGRIRVGHKNLEA